MYQDIKLGGRIICGKIVSGSIMENDQIVIQPSGLLTKIKNI